MKNNREELIYRDEKNEFLGKKRENQNQSNLINNNTSNNFKNYISNGSKNLQNPNFQNRDKPNSTLNLKEKSNSPVIKKIQSNEYKEANSYNIPYNNNKNVQIDHSNNHNNYTYNNFNINNNKNNNQNFSSNFNYINNPNSCKTIKNYANSNPNFNRSFKNNNNYYKFDDRNNGYSRNQNFSEKGNFSNNIKNKNNRYFNDTNKNAKDDQLRISYYGLENLPIMNHKQEILNLLTTEQVIIISGTTGCGKTTQVPKFIYEKLKNDFPDIFELDQQGNKKSHRKILITQPRRIAAVSIAKRLCQELKCQLGKEVGYHVGLNPNYNQDTRIIICTTGIFLQKLINDNSIKDYAYIIIDEVHERDCDIDLLLVLLKHLIRKTPQVKLILMSATISIKLFSAYFNRASIENIRKSDIYQDLKIDKAIKFEERKDLWYDPMYKDEEFLKKLSGKIDEESRRQDAAKVVEIKMKIYDVKSFYLETIEKKLFDDYSDIDLFKPILRGAPANSKSNPSIDKNLYGIAFLIILQILEGYLGEDKNNSILIFLPGINEILECERNIKTYLEKHNPEFLQLIKIYQLHSAISDEEQQQIFNFSPERKIIISTNIAESSITIPDTKYVIDFCLVKELKYSMIHDTESLELTWSSKASCDQRKGRAGRVSEGFCFRLVKESFFRNDLSNSSCAEILRVPLEKTILRLKVWNRGEPADILGRCIEPPNIKLVNLAIHNLQNYGALTLSSKNSLTGELTQLGKIYSILPLEIKYSRLIILAYAFNLMEPAIIIASLLTQEKSIFKISNPIELYDTKIFYSNGSDCDFITSYFAYVQWFSSFYKDYTFNSNNRISYNEMEEEKRECEKLKLNYYIAKEVKVLSFDILKRMKKLNYLKTEELGFKVEKLNIKKNEDDIFFLKIVFAGAFYGKIMKATYASVDMIAKRQQEIIKKDNQEENKYELQNCLFMRTFEDNDKNYSVEIATLIKNIFQFDVMIEIHNKVCEYVIFFNEKKENNKRLIQKLLNMASFSRAKDSIFAINDDKTDFSYKGPKYTKNIKLPKPDYPYEIKLYDIFYNKAVENELNSINHVIIEPNKNNLNNTFFISDNFYNRNTKYFCRNSSKLPEIAMIDKLLILIFTPTAEFFPFNLNNNNENEMYGYSHFRTFGCANEFFFSHTFSSEDVNKLNKIRKKINELVLGLYDFETYESQTKILRIIVKQLLYRKRFKIITNPDWWRIFCHYYRNEFEKIKSYQRFFDNSEFSKDDDENSLTNYLKARNPKEFFEKNQYHNFYAERIKIENKNLEQYQSRISSDCSEDGSDSLDSNSSSDSDSDNKSMKKKIKKKNKIQKNQEIIKIEIEHSENNNDIKNYSDIIKIKEDDELNENNNDQIKIDDNSIQFIGITNKRSNYNEKLERNYLENLSKTFLPELTRLKYREDNRLFTSDGEADLISEREKFKEMTKQLFKDFEILRDLLNEDSPSIRCSMCEGYICGVNNLTPVNGLHRISGWVDPFIKEIDLKDEVFFNGFVQSIISSSENSYNKDFKISKLIKCLDGEHVFGFKNIKGEIFITNNSPVNVHYPCGEKEPFNSNLAADFYAIIHGKNIESMIKRNEIIKQKAHCLLCNYSFRNFNIKEISDKRREHFEKSKFHKEMAKELIEESFE